MTPDAYVIEYDADNRVLAVRFGTVVTDHTLLRFFDDAPGYVGGRDVAGTLIDYSAVVTVDVTSATMRTIGARPPLLADPMPRVIVAPRDVVFGLARMALGHSHGRDHLHIVRSLEDAHRILGIQDPRFVVLDSAADFAR